LFVKALRGAAFGKGAGAASAAKNAQKENTSPFYGSFLLHGCSPFYVVFVFSNILSTLLYRNIRGLSRGGAVLWRGFLAATFSLLHARKKRAKTDAWRTTTVRAPKKQGPTGRVRPWDLEKG
jgi:hypothetical protein